jgi:hypothetical protein
MDNRPFADPSDGDLILEYDAYVKTTVKGGGSPLTPDAWIATRKPAPKPVQPAKSTERDTRSIQNAFAALLIPQGFGSHAERTRAEIQREYEIKRYVNTVFNKLLDAECLKRKNNSLTIVS